MQGKMSKISFIYILIISVLFAHCSNKTEPSIIKNKINYSNMKLSESEYKEWNAEEATRHSFKKEKTIGEVSYSAEYVPQDKMALREFRTKNITEMEWQEALSHYEGLEYFTFKITHHNSNNEILKKDIASQAEYNNRILYCSFDMQKDLKIVTDKNDTVKCTLFHFERHYDATPFCTFQIAFEKDKLYQNNKIVKEWTLIFNDNLFNNGLIKLNFLVDNLKNTPKIKFL